MGRASVIAAAAVAAALAACGEDEPTKRERPQVPRQLATALAAESEGIAQSLDAGQDCAARRQAQALRAHIGDAVSSGDVPPRLAVEMSEAAQDLADGIVCEPEPVAPPEPPPTTTEETTPAPTGCEAIEAQLEQLKEQEDLSKQQGPGSVAAELKKQLKEQAKELEEQLREECEEEDRGGEGGPGNSDHGGDGGPGGGRGDGGGDGD